MKIGILGCTGRVGKLLVEELQSGAWESLNLAGGTVRAGSATEGSFFITDTPETLMQQSDALIDFTTPDTTRKHVALATQYKLPIVIGTTGLNSEDEDALKEAAKQTPIVYAANTSIGVTLLADLVQRAAAKLHDDWDIEIFEVHHKHKIDAPSGTALALGHAAAAGRDVALKNVADYARHGETGSRQEGRIGFAVARGGDVVGEHDVTFYGEGERITLSHKATNRALFAKGALRAVLWLKDQPPGLYSMKDVLGL